MTSQTLFPLEHPALQSMREALAEWGYDDLRPNYPLRAFHDVGDLVVQIAFDDPDPVVLCHPVDVGNVDDPGSQVAA
jgi:hypothetical protein